MRIYEASVSIRKQAADTHIQRLEIIQHNALRKITDTPWYMSKNNWEDKEINMKDDD